MTGFSTDPRGLSRIEKIEQALLSLFSANGFLTTSGADASGDLIIQTGTPPVERARISSGGVVKGLLGGAPDVIAARPTGVAATDTANLAAAVGDTPAGGFLLIPGDNTDKTVPYLLNAPLVIDKHIRIEGSSLSETWVNSGAGGALNHPSGVSGAVLEQVTAATDVLQLSGSAISVRIRNLGLTFAAAILDSDTGHGLNAYPSLVNGSGHDSGLMGFLIDNVVVFGHDGNHYAFQFRNAMLGRCSHLRGYGGGGILIDCDSYVGNFGNTVFDDTYMEVVDSGTADAYRLQSRAARGGSAGHLNLITFIRPQANITGAAQTAGTQYLFNTNGGSNLPSRIDIIDPDLETAGTNPIDFGGVNSGTVVRAKGGLINGTPTNGFDGEVGYKKFTASGTWIAPDGVYQIRTRVIGGGGGGGGGGTNSAAAANSGGGGGGAGLVTDTMIAVTPRSTYTISIGTAGTSGTAGVTGGNAGGAGGVGGQSAIVELAVKANGGGGGGGGPASATTSAGGGLFARTGTSTTQFIPGFGAVSANPNGLDSIPFPPGVVGGAGGGASNTTNGGGGGAAATGTLPAYAAQGGGQAHTSSDANGAAGTTATTPGCGGGGGGGAPSGGTGGAGGAGATGSIEIWW